VAAKTLDRRVEYLWIVGWAVAPLAVALAGIIVLATPASEWVGMALLACAVLGLTMAFIYPVALYRSWQYELRPLELITRHGVFVTVERWLPRARVQYVDVAAGPLARALGLRRLVIYTAGSRLMTVEIPGIPTAEAIELRSELLSWAAADDETPVTDDRETMAGAED